MYNKYFYDIYIYRIENRNWFDTGKNFDARSFRFRANNIQKSKDEMVFVF